MLHMLEKYCYVALNWEAEDRQRWNCRTSFQNPAV